MILPYSEQVHVATLAGRDAVHIGCVRMQPNQEKEYIG